ncbi:hypothetical protein V8G54_017267 [Vigna mungo]|uniref:Uncharacterized protein n=1 Tax=Vigna mungo TaxID=3915 RepID=A0AAQ3S043_VIGMU
MWDTDFRASTISATTKCFSMWDTDFLPSSTVIPLAAGDAAVSTKDTDFLPSTNPPAGDPNSKQEVDFLASTNSPPPPPMSTSLLPLPLPPPLKTRVLEILCNQLSELDFLSCPTPCSNSFFL